MTHSIGCSRRISRSSSPITANRAHSSADLSTHQPCQLHVHGYQEEGTTKRPSHASSQSLTVSILPRRGRTCSSLAATKEEFARFVESKLAEHDAYIREMARTCRDTELAMVGIRPLTHSDDAW